MVRSLYWFHIYFTIRRILSEMKCPPPQDSLWSAFNNNINIIEYERICRKFGVEHKMPRCVDDSVSLALGRVSSVRGLLDDGGHDPNKDSFTQPGDGVTDGEYHNLCRDRKMKINIKKLQQDLPSYFWQQFTLDVSSGFTKAGILRIDSIIKTYVYCILGHAS